MIEPNQDEIVKAALSVLDASLKEKEKFEEISEILREKIRELFLAYKDDDKEFDFPKRSSELLSPVLLQNERRKSISLQEENLELERTISESRIESERRIQSRDKKIRNLEVHIEKLSFSEKRLADEVEISNTKIKELNKRNQYLQSRINEGKKNSENLMKEMRALFSEAEEKKLNEVKKITNENHILSRRLRDSLEENFMLFSLIDSLRKEIKRIEEKNSDLEKSERNSREISLSNNLSHFEDVFSSSDHVQEEEDEKDGTYRYSSLPRNFIAKQSQIKAASYLSNELEKANKESVNEKLREELRFLRNYVVNLAKFFLNNFLFVEVSEYSFGKGKEERYSLASLATSFLLRIMEIEEKEQEEMFKSLKSDFEKICSDAIEGKNDDYTKKILEDPFFSFIAFSEKKKIRELENCMRQECARLELEGELLRGNIISLESKLQSEEFEKRKINSENTFLRENNRISFDQRREEFFSKIRDQEGKTIDELEEGTQNFSVKINKSKTVFKLSMFLFLTSTSFFLIFLFLSREKKDSLTRKTKT
jgi:hypothetical protein